MRLSRLIPFAALGLFVVALLVRIFNPPSELERLPPPPMGAEARAFPPLEKHLGNARFSGHVFDKLGRPVAGALIFLDLDERPLWTESDADGAFSFEALPPPPWSGTIAHFDWRARRFEAVADSFEMRLQEKFEDPPQLPGVVRSPLAGHVRSARTLDADLTGYELLLVPRETEDLQRGAVPRRILLDAQGKFRFSDLAQANYNLSVLPEWAMGGRDPDLLLGDDRLFEHDGSEELVLRLASGGFQGRVVDDQGRTIEGALLYVVPVAREDFPWPPRATDEAGAFAIPDLVGGEVYAIRARAGDLRVETSAYVPAGETVVLELVLR